MKKNVTSFANRRNHRGGISVVVLVIAAVVAVGALVYWKVSEGPTKQSLKNLAHDITTWTDKDIVAYPELYFSYAIDQFKAKQDDLKANKLAIAREKVKAEQDYETHKNKEAALNKNLEAAKVAYKAAPDVTDAEGKVTGKTFPITAGPVVFNSVKEFNLQVALALKRRDLETKLATNFKGLQTKLEDALVKIEAQDTQIQLQLETAKGNLELIKAGKTIAGIEKAGNEIKDIMINTDLIAKETTPGKLTLIDAANADASNAGSDADTAAIADFLK
jgi:hypothetical protein